MFALLGGTISHLAMARLMILGTLTLHVLLNEEICVVVV